MAVRVAIFDDMLAARGEQFHIPGLEVEVHADADAAEQVTADVVCMDFAMGPEHRSGADAIRALRAAGFAGRIVAMSSDPSANREMIEAGADEALPQKAMLRSFLVALGKAPGKEG